MLKARTKIVIAIIVIAILLLLFFIIRSLAVNGFTNTIFAPFKAIGSTLVRFPTFFGEKNELQKQNTALQDTITRLAVDRAKFERLENEVNELKAFLKYQESTTSQTTTARVLGYTHDPFTATIKINKGSKDGITKGLPVLVRGGIFIGTVSKVNENDSIVLLALDGRSKVAARITGVDGGLGILEGHAVVYRLTLIPREINFDLNSVAVTDPFSLGVADQYVVGVVTGIEEDPNTPFKTAIIEPLVPIETISFVAVVTSEQ